MGIERQVDKAIKRAQIELLETIKEKMLKLSPAEPLCNVIEIINTYIDELEGESHGNVL